MLEAYNLVQSLKAVAVPAPKLILDLDAGSKANEALAVDEAAAPGADEAIPGMLAFPVAGSQDPPFSRFSRLHPPSSEIGRITFTDRQEAPFRHDHMIEHRDPQGFRNLHQPPRGNQVRFRRLQVA